MRTGQKTKQVRDHLIAIIELLKSGYWYDRKVRDVLKPFGISHEQFNVLKVLEYHHPRKFSLKEIQSRLMNKTSNATRLVEKLRLKELISSKQSEDRRALEIKITRTGLQLVKKIEGPLFNLSDKIDSILSTGDAKKLIRILRKLRSDF